MFLVRNGFSFEEAGRLSDARRSAAVIVVKRQRVQERAELIREIVSGISTR